MNTGKLGAGPRIGTISSVSAADRMCTVVARGSAVPAFLTDQTVDWAVVGATAVLIPIGDTYYVSATVGGTGTGGVGESLGAELLPNPDFEYGDTMPTGWLDWPWVAGNYATSRDTTAGQAVSGSARVLATLSPGTVNPQINVWPSSAIAVDAGTTYRCSVWVKASAVVASLSVTLCVISAPVTGEATYFGTGAVKTDVAVVASPGAAYQLLTGLVTVPTGHGQARVFLFAGADATIAAPVDVSWDLASLRQRITS